VLARMQELATAGSEFCVCAGAAVAPRPQRVDRGGSEEVGYVVPAECVQIERMAPPSTGIIAPVVKDAAGDSRNAAARPNSSGSPYLRSGIR